MGSVKDEWDRLDDGSLTRYELAEMLGCEPTYVSHLRNVWRTRRADPGGRRCPRCDFIEEPRYPIMTAKMVEKMRSMGYTVKAREVVGICLPCFLIVNKIDSLLFYEREDWQKLVEWRPGDDGEETFFDHMRQDLGELLERTTLADLARERGVDPDSLEYFLNSPCKGANVKHTVNVAKALGIHPPNGKGIGRRYGVPGRLVCHAVRGW